MLKVKNISKKLGDFSLQDINFEVAKGDYFVLLGISGAGKSLLLEMIAGLTQPCSGQIFLEDKEITNEKIQKRPIGLVFQDAAIFPHLSVYENIAFPLKCKKISKTKIDETVKSIAADTNILHLLQRKPETLSGGEKQRVAIARTLAMQPKCLLLDEPLASLDVQLKNDFRALLRKINRNGQTIIHVTHDYKEAISLANRIGVLENGTISQVASPDEVFHHPKTEFVANFVGIKNFFAGSLVENQNGEKQFRTSNISLVLLTNEQQGDGFIIIKNEDILFSEQPNKLNSINLFEGEIIDIEPTKMKLEINIDIGIKLAVLVNKTALENYNLAIGQKIWTQINPDTIQFFRNG